MGSWRRQRFSTIEDQVAAYLPWMAHLLHLLPWDIERLTWSEWTTYREWINERMGDGNG